MPTHLPGSIETMLLRLLDSVLPPLCLGCNEIVAEPGALCVACWPAFSFIALVKSASV